MDFTKPVQGYLIHFYISYEPFADISKWQVIIFSKNCLRRLTGPYHPQ